MVSDVLNPEHRVTSCNLQCTIAPSLFPLCVSSSWDELADGLLRLGRQQAD